LQSHKIALLVIAILGIACYANSLNGDFIWDDHQLVKDNAYIRSWSHVGKIFSENIASGSGKTYNSYRPLQMITYIIDYSLWGLDVRGYHLTNTLLHVLAALSIYWLTLLLFKDQFVSCLAALFFVIHPIHTEAVTYISGRAAPLCLLLMLLCFIFYIKRILLLAILCYAAALLSRENSLILPLLLLLYHYSFKEKIRIKEYLPVAGLAILYMILRVTVLSHLLPHASSGTTLIERLPGSFAAFTNYLRLLVMPFGLHMEYGNPQFSFAHPNVIFGILLLSVLLIYAFKRRNERIVLFSVSWFFIALLPVLNLYPLIIGYMAEHWLYVPSVGFFLVLAGGLSAMRGQKEMKTFAMGLIIFLITVYSFATMRQNIFWSDPVLLYVRTLEYSPDSVRALNALGMSFVGEDKAADAIKLYKRALEIKPDEKEIYYNLGVAYWKKGELGEAKKMLKAAIALDPGYINAHNALGAVHRDMGRVKDALSSFKKAAEISPYYVNAYINMGLAYSDTGKRQEAISAYKKAIEIDPTNALAYNNLSIEYYNAKRYKEAVKYCDKAEQLGHANPKLVEALKPHR